jgi:hypothetical protein
MEEAPENSKESTHSAHANGMKLEPFSYIYKYFIHVNFKIFRAGIIYHYTSFNST